MADNYDDNDKEERLLGAQQQNNEPVYMHALYSPQLEGYEQKRYEAFLNDDEDYNKFQYTLFQKCLAEFIGSVFFGYSVASFAGKNIWLVLLGLWVPVFFTHTISGGVLNPGLTTVLMLVPQKSIQLPFQTGMFYQAAQYIGCFAGALLSYIHKGSTYYFDIRKEFAETEEAPELTQQDLTRCFLGEFYGMFLFSMVLLFALNKKIFRNNFVTITFIVFGLCLSAQWTPWSQGAINPGMALGINLCYSLVHNKPEAMKYLYLYLLAEYCGAAFCVLFYQLIYRKLLNFKTQDDEKFKSKRHTVQQAIVAEFIGTAFFAYTVSTLAKESLWSVVLGLFINLVIVHTISGGVLNPSISLTLIIMPSRILKMKKLRGFSYIASQILGSFFGALLSKLIAKSDFYFTIEVNTNRHIFFDLFRACFDEFIGTFLFVMVVIVCWNKKVFKNPIFACAFVALGLGLAASWASYSGGSINPALTIGLNVFQAMYNNSSEPLKYIYLYLIGEIAGVFAAVNFYHYVFRDILNYQTQEKLDEQIQQDLKKRQQEETEEDEDEDNEEDNENEEENEDEEEEDENEEDDEEKQNKSKSSKKDDDEDEDEEEEEEEEDEDEEKKSDEDEDSDDSDKKNKKNKNQKQSQEMKNIKKK